MIVTTVHIKVKEPFVKAFIKASIENHQQSVLESGNLRFDILQHQDDPSQFTFYEAYESEATALAHKKTSHYLLWKTTVADWMEEPRKGVRHNVIEPAGLKKWL